MKILWIDLNSSYAHSSLALPALHAQIADDTSIEWASVSATINENIGTIVEEAYRHKPDILAATAWLFNHEQLLHITSRLKALLPETCLILGGPEFLGDNEFFLRKKPFPGGCHAGTIRNSGIQSPGCASWILMRNTETTEQPGF